MTKKKVGKNAKISKKSKSKSSPLVSNIPKTTKKIKKLKKIKNSKKKEENKNLKKKKIKKTKNNKTNKNNIKKEVKEKEKFTPYFTTITNDNGEEETDLYYPIDSPEDVCYFDEDLENIVPEDFDIYKIPQTIEENERYLKYLLSDSDILLELLDARDIYNSIDKNIETQLMKTNNKKLLIYVISKIDLVSNNYLQKISENLKDKTSNKFPIIPLTCFNREKINTFYSKLKQEIIKFKQNMNNNTKNKNNKTNYFKVGILGFPNVGKYSLIKSLELLINCNSDDRYMFFEKNKTFCVNSIPATIFDKKENQPKLISKKYKTIEDIPNPLLVIKNLFDFVEKEKIKKIYELSQNQKFENIEEFITLLKKKFGIKNDKIIAYQILKDIVKGKILYETKY